MPYNGSGTFIPLTPPNFPAVAGSTITAAAFNNVVLDLINNGLSNAVTRDGQGAFLSDVNLGGSKIYNLANPTLAGDAANKGYADTKLSRAGGSMTGPLDMGNQALSNLPTPVAASDAATKGYVDTGVASCVSKTGNSTVAGEITAVRFIGPLQGNADGLSTPLVVASGGTGANNASAARTNLGIGSMATRALTISTSLPTGGADGDVWFRI